MRFPPLRPLRKPSVLAPLLVAFLPYVAGAQVSEALPDTILAGVVLDGVTGTPLVGAFVSVRGSQWGSITGSDGRFLLPRVPRGPFEIQAEQLGYDTLHFSADGGEGPLVLTLHMRPRPILLEGLKVVADRFRDRRNASPYPVRVATRDMLATSAQGDLVQFLSSYMGIMTTMCPSDYPSGTCAWVRGRVTNPKIYLDEMPVFGGLDYLEMYRPHELAMIEVYGHGRQIRAYTEQFMERAAESGFFPFPYPILVF